MKKLSLLPTILLASGMTSQATIINVNETNLFGDTAAIIEHGNFAEDALSFSDRFHNHNGAAFDANGLLVQTQFLPATTIIGLPSYMLGGDYVRFANNARENAGYSADVTADVMTTWYLLVDNRINGPDVFNFSSNTTDPVLGGSLQWVIDGGWQRVNTGISPNGQADYTGVDEGGQFGGTGSGPGVSLNQFYSVYTLDATHVSVTVGNNGVGASNMISLVGVAHVPDSGTTALMLGLGLLGLAGVRRKLSRA